MAIFTMNTINGFILNDSRHGHVPAGTDVRPIMEDGAIEPIKRLSAKVEGVFRTYVSTSPYLKLAYYEFPTPIQGYNGFIATWANVV